MDWCPWIRSIDAPVLLRADGTFGCDDPVSWPQLYHPDAPHLPCIPVSDTSPNSPVQMIRRGLRKQQVAFTDEWDDNHRVGTVSEDLMRKLDSHIEHFLKDTQNFFSATKKPHFRLKYLTRSLETAIDRISKLKDTLPQLRIMFGLVSRFYLEAQGYIYYHQKYRPMLESQTEPTINPNLVGVLVEDERVCGEYHRMGIPVWYIRKREDISVVKDKFVKYSEPRIYQSRPLWPLDCFRDDGVVRGEPVILQEQTETSNFLKVVDSWVKPRLEAGFR